MRTTIGQILVNEALPEESRDYTRVMDKDTADGILKQIADKGDPDLYKKVSNRLDRIGAKASFDEGVTLRLRDLRPIISSTRKDVLAYIDREEERIDDNPDLSEKQKNELKAELFSAASESLVTETYDKSLKAENPLALQVKAKARGNKGQLTGILTTPGTYQDHRGATVPVFIRRSYSEGLRPDEYWSAAHGGRVGVISTKTSTAKGGYLGKLLSDAALETIVTTEDCGTSNGIPVATNDADNIGSVLAKDVGKFKAGTVITREVISDLNKAKKDEIVIRSPSTCSQHDGVCQLCTGQRESGGFPPLGYHLGQVAASAVREPVAQQALNCLAGDTLVLMADWTNKQIKDIVIGDRVMGSNLQGEIEPTTVTNVFDNGTRECVDTQFIVNGCNHASSRISVIATPDHKFLSSRRVSNQLDEVNNFIPRMLPIGTTSKYFYGNTPTTYNGPGVDVDFDWLLGCLLGDGCYTEKVRGIHLTSADAKEIDDLRDGLQGTGIVITKLRNHEWYYRISTGKDTSGLVPWMKDNDVIHKYAKDKRIPDAVNTWSNRSIGRLLGGLIASDGSVYRCSKTGKPGISLASTSIGLLEDAKRLLLLRFGILTSDVTRTSKKGNLCGVQPNEEGRKYVRVNDGYQLTITNLFALIKLASVIDIPGVKKERLKTYLQEYRGNMDSGNYLAFKRISQEPVGPLPTYDIEVDNEDHLFVLANGLICSNSKHTGKRYQGQGFSGFEHIKNFTTVPKVYPDRAAVAKQDGRVTKIEPAPQGGTNIWIGDTLHHALTDMEPTVKVGDTVEAGDLLSDGVGNPYEIVKHKGIGEGRRYFIDNWTKILRNSGITTNRRNIEALARSIINHVDIEDEDAAGDQLPGTTATYTGWSKGYQPREGSITTTPGKAVGKYLEAPTMHYSIGTRITPSAVNRLNKHGYDEIVVNDREPGVIPNMKSVTRTSEFSEDWMGQLGSSYLEKRLLQSAQTGAVADAHGINPLPGVAKANELGDPPPGSLSPW